MKREEKEEQSEILQRFSFTLPSKLIEKVDQVSQSLKMNRSMIVREALHDWLTKIALEEKYTGTGMGIITFVYNHHDTRVVMELLKAQHNHEEVIISNTHVHLTHESCFELVIVKGDFGRIHVLGNEIRGIKGVSNYTLTFSIKE